jgi:crotonobetainyl-CoA:carnitine CoA-transferase CaiB-like acyl-CoA transferase
MGQLPLSQIKVLDLSRVLAGPLCTMLLGDLGADVIKVERPGRGDDTREWGPPFDERGESAYYLSINRNKLSLAADLADDADRTLLLELIRGADVVVENFLPGALARLGIDAAAEMDRNPRLVWCGITGFGPDSTRPGYDFVVQAESGWMAITGEPDGPPMKSGVALADVVAGKDAAVAILAALLGRDQGASRHVSLSLRGLRDT